MKARLTHYSNKALAATPFVWQGYFLNLRTVTWPKMTCRMQAIKATAAVIPNNVENKLISSSYSPKTPRELSNTNNAPKIAEVMNNQ